MKISARRFALLLALLTPVAFAQTALAPRAEVWMGGRNPIKPFHGQTAPGQDFFQMFEPGAPWVRTAEGIKVFELPPSLIYDASKEQLAQIFAGLEARHIALGVEFGWLHVRPGTLCGKGIEGFAAPGSAGLMARIIKAAGGNLQYVDMDEPLEFGHNYSGQGACHYTIAETAQVVAEGVAQVRAVFPQAKIGDTEPVGSLDATWPGQVREWMQAYQLATGTPLAFFHADIQWSRHWQQQVPPIKGAAHQAHMPFGIIYDGVGQTTEAWTAGAVQRFRQIEANPQWRPDQAIIKSWEIFPTRFLPESRPGTLTNLALQYLQR